MSYQVGDLVWAKIRGYSPWPGLVSEPWPELRTSKKGPNKTFIYFFGSKNYGWSSASNLKPYHEFKDELKEFSKKSNFKLAIEEIEKYIENAEKFKSSSSITDSHNEICNGTTNGVIIHNGINEDSRESSVIQEKSMQLNDKGLDVSVILPRVDIYDCKRCSRAYLSLVELEDHAIDTHMDTAHVALDRLGDLCCDKCGSRFANSFDYTMHMLSHLRENILDTFDEKMPNNNNDCRALEEKFQCKTCDAKKLLENTLIAHLDVHDSMPHSCGCGEECPTKKDLVAHKRSHHPSSRKTKTKRLKQKTKEATLSRNSSSKNNKSDTKTEKKRKRKKGRNFMKERTKTIQKSSAKEALKKRRAETKTIIIEKELMKNLTRNHNNKIVCPICNKEIGRKRFPIHYRIHTGDKRYSCKVCRKSFVQQATLNVHFKKHTGAKDYFCKFCNKSFYDISALTRHERTHTGYKPYECSYKYCAKRFSDPSAFKRHLRIHTSDKRYTCDQCPKAFTDHSGLFYHKKRHNNDRKHICAICGKGFYVNYYLKKHMKSKHLPKNKKHKGETYVTRNLKTHKSVVHSNAKKFHCDYCGRIYNAKRSLIKHIRHHHMAIFYCKKCNSKFNLESDFRRHKKKKCAKNILVCEICDKTLSKRSYKRHIYRHAGIAPVECHYCGKRFLSKSAIRIHISNSHLGFLADDHRVPKKLRIDLKKITFKRTQTLHR